MLRHEGVRPQGTQRVLHGLTEHLLLVSLALISDLVAVVVPSVDLMRRLLEAQRQDRHECVHTNQPDQKDEEVEKNRRKLRLCVFSSL